MKKILLLIALLFLSACGERASDVLRDQSDQSALRENGSVVMFQSEYLVFACIDELSSLAIHVVRVEVLDEWMESENTLNRIRILEVFKGGLEEGSITEVGQMGGELGSAHFVNLDLTPLRVGDDLILFLHDRPYAATLSLLNPSQSAYRVSSAISSAAQETGIIHAFNANQISDGEVLASVNYRNDLLITIGDLVRIANKYLGGY